MNKINDWRESLRNVLNELGYDDEDEYGRCVWSPSENPELDLPESKDSDRINVTNYTNIHSSWFFNWVIHTLFEFCILRILRHSKKQVQFEREKSY